VVPREASRNGPNWRHVRGRWTEFLRYVKDDRQRKPSTIAGYESIIRSMLLPAFGEEPVESITTAQIERWLAGLPQSARTKTLALVLLHGIFRRAKKVWGLSSNPAAEVEKPPAARGNDLQVFSPQEVWALVRAADNPQDAPSSSPHRSPA
jgi:integrase